MSTEQRFRYGDRVKISTDLGPGMSHFRSGCEAIVVASYNEQFGGGNTRDYTLYLKGSGEVSWYMENQLVLIEKGRVDLLEQWKRDAAEEATRKGDPDWIFANGRDVLTRPHGYSIEALAECLGVKNLWGPRGEGLTYFANARLVLSLAEPYLMSGDKAGWLAYCERATARK